MIKTIIMIAKLLAAILPFVALCFVSKKVNLSKSERSRQYPMTIVALVYVTVTMLLMHPINEWLLKLLDKIPGWIESLASVSWMPEKIAGWIDKGSELLETLFQNLDLRFWLFFITNTAMIVGYLFVKKIALAFIDKTVTADSALHTKVAEIFYEFFPDVSKWCLKEHFVYVRLVFKVFYYSAVIFSSTLMLVSRYFFYEGIFRTVFYPVFGIIVVGELYFYLDGTTKREYVDYISGEDDDAFTNVNYSLLRKFLRSVFGDKVLTENTSINNDISYGVTTDDVIRELEISEDPKVASFASYFGALHRSGYQIEHNYLRSSLDLLEDKSILFNNPFYNDLIPYAFYPMNRALLAHRKVLVILGRHSIEEDIKDWIHRGVALVTNLPFMWNVSVLNGNGPDDENEIDIGIVTRSDVLNVELHEANAEFLEQVGFVVILEPSKLISTAQIGLNLLVKRCRTEEDKKIVYCLCDKNCDGLVDAMSHILMTSLTEVSATRKHLGTASYMCWEAGDEYLHHRLVPNISRYLGIGTELSFAALKNQVSKTKWYGGEAFPVTDMRWIGSQYYFDLTKYANLPTVQRSMDEHFAVTSNFWSAEVQKNSYLTVEDESYNMFEILREFSTRTTEQGFVNVISSEYLLKDYMADNASIFEADAKAIPYIVADYTRSNRNTILRLVLMMSIYPVCEEQLSKELSLLGITVFDLKRQLWFELYKCYSRVADIASLPKDYKEAVLAVYPEKIALEGVEWDHDLIEVRDIFNLKNGRMETTYSIRDASFLKICVAGLRSAGYIAEDEKGEEYYLGAELAGHIYQKYLPGQFFTFGGKYYEMQYLTADGQILVRRAADHITGRPGYRQLRDYVIYGVKASDKIGACQNIAGMKVVKEFADISVDTPGYFRMDKYNDFAGAKRIGFEGSSNGIPRRTYHNKEILRIELPELDGKLSDSIRYTVTVLFNEIFKTIFAENQAYICALTDEAFLGDRDGSDPLTYSLRGEGYEPDRNSIYIVEDSQLDLGLTVAVERNLERIFSIIHDYLDWHLETLEESLVPPTDEEPPVIFTDPEGGEAAKKKRSIFGAIGDGIKGFFGKIKNLFKKKPKSEDEPKPDPEEDAEKEAPEMPEIPEIPEGPEFPEATEDDDNNEYGAAEPAEEDEKAGKKRKKKGLFAWLFGWMKRGKKTDDTLPEIPEDEIPSEVAEPEAPEAGDVEPIDDPSAEEQEQKIPVEMVEAPGDGEITETAGSGATATKVGFSTERKPYYERYYLLYGAEREPGYLDISGTLAYLGEMGFKSNPLKQAREGKKIAEFVEATFKPGKPDARYCDFCGTEIYGVEYDTLADGRDRCMSCSRTAIKTSDEFRHIFEDVKRNMESFFGIRINAGIRVEMVNSKTLHKRLGKAFIPTSDSDGRVLGVAIKDKDGYSLLVENGSPRMASMMTMAHELTHIWQYLNWNDKAIRKKYGKKLRLEIYEGMAKWVEIQYAYLINESANAKREELITAHRDDEYGRGFMRYRACYPFSTGTVITRPTPFLSVEEPLDPAYCGDFIVNLPTDDGGPAGEKKPKPTGGRTGGGSDAVKGPVERDPENVRRYAYNCLNDAEKALYEKVIEAICSFRPKVDGIEGGLTTEQVEKILDHVDRDNPVTFWYRRGATYYFDKATKIVSSIDLRYCMTEDEAKRRQQEIDSAIGAFLESVNDTMSDYEVTLRIYENIIGLVDYDTIGLERQKKTTVPDDKPDDLRSIYGVFVNKKAVCAGYAKAMQYLLNRFGIECLYVTSDTHAWNLIKLEGNYYHMDVTWGDGSNTSKEKEHSSAINYDCFCITTDEVLKLESHTPEKIIALPRCTATKCNYHRRFGLFFESFSEERIKTAVCDAVKDGKSDVSFKFADIAVFKDSKKQLVERGIFGEAIRLAALKANVKLDTSYKYTAAEDRLTMTFHITRL